MSSEDATDGMEIDDPNVIRLKVENVKDLDWFGVSKEKRIDGFPWRIRLFREERDELELSVKCQKSRESRVWEVVVDAEAKLINHVDDSRSHCKGFSMPISVENFHTRNEDFGKFDEIVGDEELVIDGAIVVVVKIVVKEMNGDRLRKRAKYDFFSPSNYSDIILSVEGKKLHVSKQILANASKYFEILFFGNFKKSEENEIVIDDDVPFEDFFTVVELIYDTGRELNETNVEAVLMVADRFQIQNVMNEAEEELNWHMNLPGHLTLLLNHQYNFYYPKSLNLCNYAASSESFERLMKSKSIKRYSEELKKEITEWRNIHIAKDEEKITRNIESYEKRNEERLEKLKPNLDLLSPSSFSDVVLVVEGEKFYASKQILAHASSHFENLFYDDPEKINEKEFVIDDVSSKEFLVALELIYDNWKKIDTDDAEFLLDIANRFNVASLTDRSEKFLLEDLRNTVPVHKKLLLAEQYNLDVIMMKCVRNFSRCRQIVDLMKTESYSQYSSDLKSALLEKMAELWERENP